jgi:alpha-mannosidase
LVIDCIKRGEDDEDVSLGDLPKRKGHSVILRIFDSLGGKSKGRLRWGSIPVKKAWKTNVLEDDLEEVKIEKDGTEIEVEVRAFEVATYRLQL